MIFYGILDLLAGPLFLFLFLWSLRSIDYSAFGLMSTKYTDGYGRGGGGSAGPAMANRTGATNTGAGINGTRATHAV